MDLNQLVSKYLTETLSVLVDNVIKEVKSSYTSESQNQYFNFKEAAAYMGVSYRTLIKFTQNGLNVFESCGVKKISKKEIDRFISDNSY